MLFVFSGACLGLPGTITLIPPVAKRGKALYLIGKGTLVDWTNAHHIVRPDGDTSTLSRNV